MKFKRNTLRGIFFTGVIMLALCFASDTCASPLYGGYNGESEAWVEVFVIEEITIGFTLRVSVGVDPDLDVSWIRIGVSSLFLLPYISNIEISYETGDVISASLAGLLPIKVGADTNNLKWIITNLSILVSGADSDSNVWNEWGLTGVFGLPGINAYGEDNNDHQWQWIKFFPVLVGWRVDSPISSLGQEHALWCKEDLKSLHSHFERGRVPQLRAILMEKITDNEIMADMRGLSEILNARVAYLSLIAPFVCEHGEDFSAIGLSSGMSSELDLLLKYVEEEIFTEEVRDEINAFLGDFAGYVKPRLETIKRMTPAP